MNRARPTAIDLFAGAGLFSYAFHLSGFRILQAYEADPGAASTYARNVGNHVTVGDVCTVVPRGRCDVLIAGPPCQGFSTLGSRRADDPRNILSFEVVRWASQLRPQVVVIENVAAFLKSSTWSQVCERLRRLGYDVEAFELDASRYGVPQLRLRSFTIGSRIGPLARPVESKRNVTVRSALCGLSLRPDGKNSHSSPKPSALALARMRLIPAGGDKRDVMRKARKLTAPSWWRLSSQVTDAWGRMEWDSPSNTLRTCLQNPSKGRYIHPSEHRVISLREAARLQTIPDEWTFEGFPSHIARQIGNGVPVNLGTAIAKQILAILR